MEIPIPALRMPTFLQPLQLIPYWQTRIAETIRGWIRRSDEQLFGPLEQMVAAAVVIGLAMQAPETLWHTPTTPPQPQYPSSNSTDNRHSASSNQASSNPSSHSPNPLSWLQAILASRQESAGPTTLGLVAILINLVFMFVPADLKKRLMDSWTLFWPPWQDRTDSARVGLSESQRARAEKEGTVTSGSGRLEEEELMRAKEKERLKRKAAESGGTSKKDLTEEEKVEMKEKNGERAKRKAMEEPSKGTTRELTDEERMRAREKGRARRKAAEAEEPSEKGKILTEREKTRLREKQVDRSEAWAGDGLRSAVPPTANTEDLTESERARLTKDVVPDNDLSVGKGKERMRGERPKNAAASLTTTELSKTKEVPLYTESPTAKEPATDVDSASETDRSTRSNPTSGPDTEDPLMAGDYRPLKSSLKKSRKKPRQNKNIHHNYFMTMRGHRPHLVPFPHGFHPKPHHPRNDLWWDNVPKDVDHIMARPPVLKKPEEGGVEDEGEEVKVTKVTESEVSESSSGETGAKAESKSVTEVREKVAPEDRGEGTTISAAKEGSSRGKERVSGDKDVRSNKEPRPDKERGSEKEKCRGVGEEDRAKSSDKDKERAKLRLEADAKEKAKLWAEAEAKAKRREGVSKVVTEKAVPVDPRVLKATYVSQGLLCVLLYTVNEQLGLLLLAFFAYHHINKHKAKSPTESPPLPHATTLQEFTSTALERPSKTSKAQSARTGEAIPPEMQDKLEKEEAKVKPTSSKMSTGPEPSTDKGNDDTPPEMEKKLEKAEALASDRKGTIKAKAGPSNEGGSFASDPGANSMGRGAPPKRPDEKTPRNSSKSTVPSLKARVDDGEDTADVEGKGSEWTKEVAPVSDEATRYGRAKAKRDAERVKEESLVGRGDEKGKSKGQASVADNIPNTKPKTLDDLTPEQKERYLRAKAEKGKSRADKVPESRVEHRIGRRTESRAKADRSSGEVGESTAAKKVRTATAREEPRGKKLEDLTEEERDRYLRGRAERKAKERANLKRGQSSGLSAQEKEAIGSP